MNNVDEHVDIEPIMSKKLLLLMSCAISATVANLYYSQPILPQIGSDLGISGDNLGLIPASSQLGYSVALLLISPLGDNMSRKKLIGALSCSLIVASILAFLAGNLITLIIACFVIGLSANITQQLIPFAASIVAVEQKGRVIGTLMTGLTIGILGGELSLLCRLY
jgi:predicted MFS family arabinose efflux permease